MFQSKQKLGKENLQFEKACGNLQFEKACESLQLEKAMSNWHGMLVFLVYFFGPIVS